jgi:hypothetical protein
METMFMRTIVALAAVLAFGTSNGWAVAHKAPKHHRHAHIVRYQEQPVLLAPYGGGRLVMNPASNIACNTVYRSTRALPCDQPVWVYGSPCEIDLGLGRYRSCD